jgi:hypothetical protein
MLILKISRRNCFKKRQLLIEGGLQQIFFIIYISTENIQCQRIKKTIFFDTDKEFCSAASKKNEVFSLPKVSLILLPSIKPTETFSISKTIVMPFSRSSQQPISKSMMNYAKY